MADITISDTTAWNKVQEENQYSLAKILGIWVAAALPMGILGYLVYPALAPDSEADPIGAAKTRVALLTVGLIWMFVLSLFIVYREEGNLRWATIRRRFWLNTPRDTKTGEPRRKLWLWLVPFILLFLASMVTIAPILGSWWLAVFPFFEPPAGFDPGELLSSPEIQAQLVGAWDFLLLFAVLAIFNTFGEEFLFRGVLLPKMAYSAGGTGWPMVCCFRPITGTNLGGYCHSWSAAYSCLPFRLGFSAVPGCPLLSILRNTWSSFPYYLSCWALPSPYSVVKPIR